MARNFPTARYLDEPTRFAGLTAVQWLSAGLALGAAYGLWWLIGFGGPLSLPLGGPWGLGVRVFLCALCAAGVFLALTLLSGSGRREPYGQQYWSYLRRPHRYGPPTRPVTHQAPGTARSWSPRTRRGRERDTRDTGAS